MQRIEILIHLVVLSPSRHRGRQESRHSRLAVVRSIRSCEAFAAAPREVNHELRGHETGDAAADLGLEVEDGLEGSAEVFHAFDEVACVDVVL